MPNNPSAGRKKIIQSLLICLAGAGISLILFLPGWLDTLENKTWDWRAAILARPGPATDDIRMIMLDQNSLDWASRENGLSWPWPREVYTAIIGYCQRSGAKALAFDVLFTEPSKYGVSDDQAFGGSIGAFQKFVGAVSLGQTSGSHEKWPSDLPRPSIKIIGLEQWLSRTGAGGLVFPRATMPISEVAASSAVLANVHSNPDPDGVYRRAKLFAVFDREVLPFLGLGAFLAANPAAEISISPGRLVISGQTAFIDRQGRAVLRYRGPSGTHKAYSAAAVLQSEIQILSGEEPTITDKDAFKDKYVFFGFSAPGLFDLRPAPVGGVYTGVEINATMLDNILSGDFMKPTPVWLTVLLVFLLSLTSAASASFFSRTRGVIITSLVFFSLPVISAFGSYGFGLWLPLIVLELAVVLSVVLAVMINYATEGRQKRFIKGAFSQYLSPAVIDQLMQDPDRLKLGGERRMLSMFFSDLEGFTSISEGLPPEELTTLLNEYLTAMTDIITLEELGTVDKYEGDAIIAFWNAPLEVKDHAVRAVRAALNCQARLAEMNPGIRARIGRDMRMRIGLNSGLAIVGNMGSQTRFDYTMLGDQVNLAARLEGANKQFGTYTMISQATLDLLNNEFAVRELARVMVVGRKEPVTVYEPMFPNDYALRKEVLDTFAQGLKLFYQGDFTQAYNNFSLVRDEDRAADAYAVKCRELAASPPENWRGVWIMTSK